ncbi:LytTR family DNA-binding domain-containing protein [Cytophagaceae bacterium YF14B1]|uniref:LytTR family DNA-binding domain-containing protein n=1 Tax=Xanthocytophaga flava TaxID=3048013 RepID=A0AAE3QVQ5_9BACT|nr:LytTR family DNA-binding domain-containing protein [Xanthocytophaga flavus]MDJ1486285.1 LytTR family DNA-binding domain-containing protein [Xanthocytophaga flavus]
MKVIIIDDESGIREAVEKMIQWYRPTFQVVAHAETVRSGVELVRRHNPDLVFLDIQLRDGTAFELLQEFTAPAFKIIFITAFDNYAITAFKYSALDYLLKPIDPLELETALEKAEKIVNKEMLWTKLESFVNNMSISATTPRKLVLATAESLHVVNTRDIIRCEAYSNYTQFYLLDGKKILVSVTLKEYEHMLSSSGFFRSHQSHLINLTYLDRFDKRDGGMLILKDKSIVPIAARQKSELMQILKSL